MAVIYLYVCLLILSSTKDVGQYAYWKWRKETLESKDSLDNLPSTRIQCMSSIQNQVGWGLSLLWGRRGECRWTDQVPDSGSLQHLESLTVTKWKHPAQPTFEQTLYFLIYCSCTEQPHRYSRYTLNAGHAPGPLETQHLLQLESLPAGDCGSQRAALLELGLLGQEPSQALIPGGKCSWEAVIPHRNWKRVAFVQLRCLRGRRGPELTEAEGWPLTSHLLRWFIYSGWFSRAPKASCQLYISGLSQDDSKVYLKLQRLMESPLITERPTGYRSYVSDFM